MLQVSQCLRRNRQRSVGHLMLASLTLFGCFCLFKPCFAQDPNDALFISISRSDFSGVQAAIANGAYIKSDDNRLLDLASKGGNYAIVKLVIEQGVNVNSKTEQGYTALIKAVARNHYAVVKLLIEKGADVNSQTDQGYTALMAAVEIGNHNLVQYLLDAGADVHVKDEEGWTARIFASYYGHAKISRLMQQNGDDSFGKSFFAEPDNALIISAALGKADNVKIALTAGANINAIANGGYTALIAALSRSHFDVMQQLINNGADVNVRDNRGRSALMISAIDGNTKAAKLLIANGADVNATDKWDNETVLMKSANAGRVQLCKLLLQSGANLNTQDDRGYTALSRALEHNHFNIVTMLINAGARIEHVEGVSGLVQAAKKNQLELVKLLLEKQFDINVETKKGDTAWLAAAKAGSLETVKIFIENGADVNLKGIYGARALAEAAYNGHIDVVKLLIENGANIHAKGDYGTPLLSASMNNHFDVINTLIANGASVRGLLFDSIKRGNLACIKIAISKLNSDKSNQTNLINSSAVNLIDRSLIQRASSKVSDNSNHIHDPITVFLLEQDPSNQAKNQALAMAIDNDNTNIAKLLVEHGATAGEALMKAIADKDLKRAKIALTFALDINLKDAQGRTPLLAVLSLDANNIDAEYDERKTPLPLLFSRYGQQFAKLLIEAGADVNAKDKRGSTALMYSPYWGLDVAKLLVENGADVNAKNVDGNTALMRASVYKSSDVAQFFIENGADANVIGKYGYTPLMLACAYGSFDVVKLLIENGAKVNATDDYATDNYGHKLLTWSQGFPDIIQLLNQSGAR